MSQSHRKEPDGLVKVPHTRFLEGFVVFLCGFDETVKVKAKEMVIHYGGKVADKFNSQVTCGVVVRVGASGYKDLMGSKVQVMSIKWLNDCANNRSLAPMESAKYKVGVLHGLTVVCTQVTVDVRARVEELVKGNGGTFSDKFVGYKCTHLIATTPEGEKYVAAKKCGSVHIVTIAWLEECVRQKAWVPEIEYSVDYLAKQAVKAAKQAKDKLLALAAASKVSDSTKAAAKISTVEQIEQTLVKQVPVRDFPLVSCIHHTKAASIFAGEIFWIQGYSLEITDYLTMCVLAGGGFRSMVLCDDVSIVVLGDKTSLVDKTLVHRHPCGVSIVNLTWVIEQLFALEALLPLLRDKDPFAQPLQYAKSNRLALCAMDDLDACVAAYDHSMKDGAQNTVMVKSELISACEHERTPSKAEPAQTLSQSQSSRKRSKH